MDPFEVRMQFLTLLRRLNASQQSIQKVVTFAVKHAPACGDDLWDCLVEECHKGSLNARINILYLLDALCAACRPRPRAAGAPPPYAALAARDLPAIVAAVVPPGRAGRPNLVSTTQILESWRAQRVLDPPAVDAALAALAERPADGAAAGGEGPALARADVLRRIEEDRERHKRLRERRWVQPAGGTGAPLAAFARADPGLDAEFEGAWETTSDWNEDDEEVAVEEDALCFGAG